MRMYATGLSIKGPQQCDVSAVCRQYVLFNDTTPALSMTIHCHVRPYSFSLLANHQNRHQVTSKMGCHLVTADGHFLRGLRG